MPHYGVIRSLYVFAHNCYRKEIETWGKCQSVCLDETHWLMCNITYFSHFRDLTWGQISKLNFRGHVMIKVGCVAYVSMRLEKTGLVTPFPRLKLHFLKGNFQKNFWFPHDLFMWPQVTFWGSLTPNDTVQVWITAHNHTDNRLSSTASRYLKSVRRYQQKALAAPSIYVVLM